MAYYPDETEAAWQMKCLAQLHMAFPKRVRPGEDGVEREFDGTLVAHGHRLTKQTVEGGLTVAWFCVVGDSLYWCYGPDAVIRSRG